VERWAVYGCGGFLIDTSVHPLMPHALER